MQTNSEKNWATLTHLGALGQYVFPFGNFVLPIVIWISKKDQSDYVDYNGKQSLNFQLSVFLYSLILMAIIVPVFSIAVLHHFSWNELINRNHFDIDGFNFGEELGLISTGLVAIFVLVCLKVVEFFLIIQAAVKTANGVHYNYPLAISFLK